MIRKLMKFIVGLLIDKGLLTNIGKLKVGDFVRYNWKAKYYIYSVYKRELFLKEITRLEDYPSGSQSCEYVCTVTGKKSGCDVFWVSKVNN